MDGVVSFIFHDPFAATERIHDDPGLELRIVCAALAHGWEPLSGGAPSEVNDGACPEKQDHLNPLNESIGKSIPLVEAEDGTVSRKLD